MLEPKNEYFKKKLQQQVQYLKRSCNIFDNGDWNEAIRIATCIRVILHDTKNSTSILQHLKAKNIYLYSSCGDFYVKPSAIILCFNMGEIILGKGQQSSHGPNLSDFDPNSSILLPFNEWWEQVVLPISPEHQLSRKSIILTATDKDGGAHVDKELPDDYKKLSLESFGIIETTLKNGEVLQKKVDDMHFVTIRTIANELLKSPDFINLLI